MKRRLLLVIPLFLQAVACGGGAYVAPAKSAMPGPPGASPAQASDTKLAKEDEKKKSEEDKDSNAPAPPPPPGAPPREEPRREAASSGAEAVVPQRDTSKIIYTARLTMAVSKVEESLANVERIARDQEGFLAQKHDREIVIRVPRDKFQITLAAVGNTGDLLHRDIQAQDVTEEVVDLEIRIKNAHAMQDRLKLLLLKAPVKEAIEIEKELNRVTQELELLEGKIKVLKDRIAYSTITVAFEPRAANVQATRAPLPFVWLKEMGLPNLLSLSEDK